jgi:hypothetical protein
MSLGDRNARRHETTGVQKLSVIAEDFVDFRVGQRVMTSDGFPGRVAAFPGTEAYRVELDNDMGGGMYRTSDLSELRETTAELHTAETDYPELGDILTRRPDIAKG